MKRRAEGLSEVSEIEDVNMAVVVLVENAEKVSPESPQVKMESCQTVHH